MENILSGNPLLNLTGPSQPQANFKVKRRYEKSWVGVRVWPWLVFRVFYKVSRIPLSVDNLPNQILEYGRWKEVGDFILMHTYNSQVSA
jgi:hypothetical protein